jgi:hypothetical protein
MKPAIFYLKKMNQSMIEEIRKMVSMEDEIKYMIVRKGMVTYVSSKEFYYVPIHHCLVRAQ